MTLNSSRYILRETFHSMKRNPWLSIASVITVMVSLVILGFSIFFFANAANMAQSFESELEIATFVQDNTTPSQVQALKNQILEMPGVASVTIVTKEEVLKDFGKTLGGTQSNLLADLGGTNPFRDKLTIKATDPQNVITLAETVGALPEVAKVRYGQGFIDQLLRWIGLAVVGAFGIAATVLISINVKMNVFSRRREIQIMKLVGASNSFIRWPFLIEGLALGLVGGAMAAGIVGMGYNSITMYVQSSLTFLPVVQNDILFRQVSVGLLLAGMAMGALGSGISLQKFLRT